MSINKTSNFKDAFGNDIFVGSNVILMDCDYTGGFLGYAKGVVCGFTNEYVKINNLTFDRMKRYHIYDNPEIKRVAYRIICIDNL